jgi:cytochrome b pre-mRNA-processing protein 3
MLRFFRRRPEDDAALALYHTLVAKARTPDFYAAFGVPDTVDGRFDLIVTHAMLVLRRLRAGGVQTEAVGQALFDLMFKDMDRSLRELGVGDMSVGKHIKKMAKAFYGRADVQEIALDAAIASGKLESLEQALRETIFRRQAASPEGLRSLADYIRRIDRHVQSQPVDAIARGTVDFHIPVQPMEPAHAARTGA